jgi:transcriptional regulator with XRE-family HTH domain
MSRASHLIRTARQEAGLTQAELATRAGMTQSMIARMERPGANPTVDTVEAVLGAMHRRLDLEPAPRLPPVDETQILDRLRLTPQERLASHTVSSRNLANLVRRARRLV